MRETTSLEVASVVRYFLIRAMRRRWKKQARTVAERKLVMEREESRMTPRFLAESERGMDVLSSHLVTLSDQRVKGQILTQWEELSLCGPHVNCLIWFTF